MLGKTFKGLTDEMLAWQTQKLLALEIGRDDYTVYVRPELVVEIAFNDVQASPHYPGGARAAVRAREALPRRQDRRRSRHDRGGRDDLPAGPRAVGEPVIGFARLQPSVMSTTLARSIGLTQATAMVVGTIIGASIFVQPSEVSRRGAVVRRHAARLARRRAAHAGSARCICAELASAYPRTGGVYVFLREMFSPAAGFLWGWAMFWSMHSGIIAAIAMVFGALHRRRSFRSSDLRHPPRRRRRASSCSPRSTTSACGRAARCRPCSRSRRSRAIGVLLIVLFAHRARRASPATARRAIADRAGSCSRWSPDCSRSAAGTW